MSVQHPGIERAQGSIATAAGVIADEHVQVAKNGPGTRRHRQAPLQVHAVATEPCYDRGWAVAERLSPGRFRSDAALAADC